MQASQSLYYLHHLNTGIAFFLLAASSACDEFVVATPR